MCSRCGRPTSGYDASQRCQCAPEYARRTMTYNERIASLTDEGVLAAMERMTGVSDRQNRSEDRLRSKGPEAHLSAAARRARAAQRAAGYDPDEED